MKIKNKVLLGISWLDRRRQKIIIPEGVETIDTNVFYNFLHDKTGNFEVILPNTLKEIKDYAFAFAGFSEINLPDSVVIVEPEAFIHMNKLENVSLSENMSVVPFRAFFECCKLKNVNIPKGVKIIGEKAFFGCRKLENISLPESVTTIDSNAFGSCDSLKEINLPSSLEAIKAFAFANSGVAEVVLPEGLTILENSSFLKCHKLTSVEVPSTLQAISSYAFSTCSNLQNVKLKRGLKFINRAAFSKCSNLTSITIPDSVITVHEEAFSSCESLKDITIENGVSFIRKKAFLRCKALEKLSFPESVITIEESVWDLCPNLKTVEIHEDTICLANFKFKPVYITKKDNTFCLSKEPINGSSFEYHGSYPGVVVSLWSEKDKLIKEINKNPEVENLIQFLLGSLSINEVRNFFKTKDLTYFKVFCKQNPREFLSQKYYEKEVVYKLLYNLGAFEKEQNGEHISQKVVEFLINAINAGRFKSRNGTYGTIFNLFTTMKLNGYIPDFTKMFLNKDNFNELLEINSMQTDFIAKCYNSYDEVQKTNKANKGSSRQLKPTVKKFLAFFNSNKFANVTPKTKELAEFVGKFYSSQNTFDDAVKILKEKEDNNVPDHILKEPLSEKDVLKSIEEKLKNGIKIARETLEILNDVSNKFTFEWLAKNDPENLVLGKLCSCCSHLAGVGYGIMRGSIIAPNIQNLVIRDKNGNIVAKSTLYINTSEGYGVCNNFEVSDSVFTNDKVKIYKKIKVGIREFANRYNEENPERPLKIINVGLSHNDLFLELNQDCKRSGKHLKPINYGTAYGTSVLRHEGDSQTAQRTIWEK